MAQASTPPRGSAWQAADGPALSRRHRSRSRGADGLRHAGEWLVRQQRNKVAQGGARAAERAAFAAGQGPTVRSHESAISFQLEHVKPDGYGETLTATVLDDGGLSSSPPLCMTGKPGVGGNVWVQPGPWTEPDVGPAKRPRSSIVVLPAPFRRGS